MDANIMEVLNSVGTHRYTMLGLRAVMQLFASIILCSRSDSHGRKFPLILAVLCECFDMFSYLSGDINSYLHFLIYFYFMFITPSVFGGNTCILAMVYSYRTDHSSYRNRTLRFTIMDFVFMIGVLLGIYISEMMEHHQHFLGEVICITISRLLCALWVLIFFKGKELSEQEKNRPKSSFSVRAHCEATWQAISKWRSNCGAEQMYLILFSIAAVMMSYRIVEGVLIYTISHSVVFEEHEKYDRAIYFSALYSCGVGVVAILLLQSCLKCRDPVIGMIGFINLYLDLTIGAYIKDYLTFYVALGLFPLKNLAAVSLRSSFSKVVAENERGKTFFFFAFVEVAFFYFGDLLHNQTYKFLGSTYPILSYLLVNTFLIVSLCTFVFQFVSIDTEHLFSASYRSIPVKKASKEKVDVF